MADIFDIFNMPLNLTIALVAALLIFIILYTLFNKKNIKCMDGFFMIVLGLIVCGILS